MPFACPSIPGCEDDFLPCQCCSDVFWSLRSRNKDEVEAALQVVGLQRAANRSGDLKSCFPERKRSEGNAGGRNEAYCLYAESQSGKLLSQARDTYPEGRKDFGLANERRRAVLVVFVELLALHYRAIGSAVVRLGTCHVVLFANIGCGAKKARCCTKSLRR